MLGSISPTDGGLRAVSSKLDINKIVVNRIVTDCCHCQRGFWMGVRTGVRFHVQSVSVLWRNPCTVAREPKGIRELYINLSQLSPWPVVSTIRVRRPLHDPLHRVSYEPLVNIEQDRSECLSVRYRELCGPLVRGLLILQYNSNLIAR